MITTSLGAGAAAVYSSSMDCMTQFKAGAFGPITTAAAKAGYQDCLRTAPRVVNPALSAVQKAGIALVTPTTASGAGYVPNCAGPNNPCTEISKGASQGIAISDSLRAKCVTYQTTCNTPTAGEGAAGVVAETPADPNAIDPVTGLPVTSPDAMTWLSENKGTVAIGLAVLVGGIILIKAL